MAITGSLDKQRVALVSVLAAVVLTLMKLGAGLATGSLGLLAEAAHSGLDLVATLMTLFAVRIAEREPDDTHTYGHGRFENLAALVETVLLLATCTWVIVEAVGRLRSGQHHLDPSVWAFGVMLVSIAVDWSRSRALARAAHEHGSQALEADALHFSTDIWSSVVVIVGLALVWLARHVPDLAFLAPADAYAAIGVALIVVFVSARLGWETISALTDRAPPGLADEILDAARQVDGVLGAERARLRRAGNKLFADLVVSVSRTTTFAGAHAIADRVEEQVHKRVPNADVVVHVEPGVSPVESAAEQVDFLARQRGLHVHDVRVRDVGGKLEVDLHLELDPRLPLAEAHETASQLERDLMAANDQLGAVNTHMEAPAEEVTPEGDVTAISGPLVEQIKQIADRLAGPNATHEVRVYRSRDLRNLVIHATFGADVSLERVHVLSSEIERALRAELDQVGTVLIHAEPRQ